MRLFSLLLASLALTSVSSQTQPADTFCVKYAKAVFSKTAATLTGADEYNLISAVVGRVVVGCDNNAANQYGIPGVEQGPFRFYAKSACGNTSVTKVTGLVSDTLNAPFFAGSAPNYQSATGVQQLNDALGIGLGPSIRFVNVTGFTVSANPAATGTNVSEGLITHLVTYFGRDLGCSFVNPNVNTPSNGSFIGRYTGNSGMANVHKNMLITKAVWNAFIDTFANTLKSFGVTQADIDNIVVPYVQGFLQQPPGSTNTAQVICNQPDCDCIKGYNKVNNTCVAAPTNPPTSPPGKGTAAIITMNPLVVLAAIALAALL